MSEPVKFGLIGCGDAGNFHTLGCKMHPDANYKYVAAFDINQKAVDKFAKFKKLEPFTDMDAFLNYDMDAVLIAVPHFLHAEMVKKVAAAGKHVLCEKPMAPTLEECDEMIQAATDNNVKFMIAENHRFLPAHKIMKDLITKGVIGQVYLGRTYEGAFAQFKNFMDANNWQFTYKQGGGGVLADQGVHKFALMNWLVDSELESGQAWLGKALNTPINKGEDNAIMNLHYKNGAMVEVIVTSTSVHPLNNTTEFNGTKGHMLEDHSWEKPIRIFSNQPDAEKKGEYYYVEAEHGAYPAYYTISAYHEDSHFATCIQENSDPEFTPQQARAAVEVVLLGYMSAKKNRPVTLDEFREEVAANGSTQLLEDLDPYVKKNFEQLKW